jgi:hypothetical protein
MLTFSMLKKKRVGLCSLGVCCGECERLGPLLLSRAVLSLHTRALAQSFSVCGYGSSASVLERLMSDTKFAKTEKELSWQSI